MPRAIPPSIGLCFRCEYRAIFLEEQHGPRCECQMPSTAVHCCYMFKPVKPLKLAQQDKKDRRPFLGPPLLSARHYSPGVAECGDYCRAVMQGEHVVVYWRPKADAKKGSRK